MSSNIAQVTAWLSGWVDSFDFKRVGAEQSIGRDIADKIVERISGRCEDYKGIDEGGNETAWDKNSDTSTPWMPEGYRLWKEAEYGTGTPNSRTGQMLSKISLKGRTTIESKEIIMKYGTGKPPDRLAFKTGEVPDRDKDVTDTFKAYLAHTGQSKKKIKRSFCRVDESDGQAIVDICQEHLVEYITNTNRDNGY